MHARAPHSGTFQVGDVPGRKEPGTGEVNWRNVFKSDSRSWLPRNRRNGTWTFGARDGGTGKMFR